MLQFDLSQNAVSSVSEPCKGDKIENLREKISFESLHEKKMERMNNRLGGPSSSTATYAT